MNQKKSIGNLCLMGCGIIFFILGIFLFTILSEIKGNASGKIVNTTNCQVLSCEDVPSYSHGSVEECTYSGNITLFFEYQDVSYLIVTLPKTDPCSSNCCSILEEKETTVHIFFKNNDPNIIDSFTDDLSGQYFITVVLGLIFISAGLIAILTGICSFRE